MTWRSRRGRASQLQHPITRDALSVALALARWAGSVID